MSHLASLLRQVTRKASHPNSLIYSVQLERAKQKYLVRGELEDGKESAVALGAPEEEGREREQELERGREKAAVEMDGGGGSEAVDRNVEGAKGFEEDAEGDGKEDGGGRKDGLS